MTRNRTVALSTIVMLFVVGLLAASCGAEPTELSTDSEAAVPGAQPDNAGSDPAAVPTTEPLEPADPTPPPMPTVADTDDDIAPGDDPLSADDPAVSRDDVEPVADTDDESTPGDDAVSAPAPAPSDPGLEWERIEQMPELLGAQARTPDELVIADDDRTVLVRFWNGVAPCSGAKVVVTENPDTVEVLLKTGANPDAASMGCVALAVAQEIAVVLSEPLGTRSLTAVAPTQSDVPAVPDGPPPDAVFSVDQYINLTQGDAEQLADIEGRILRIARLDDEFFALTEDFVPSRVNVEIENGIVVDAFGG